MDNEVRSLFLALAALHEMCTLEFDTMDKHGFDSLIATLIHGWADNNNTDPEVVLKRIERLVKNGGGLLDE